VSLRTPPIWPEARLAYPAALRAEYREGALFGRWRDQYHGHLLFTERMRRSRQIPHSGPLKNAMFFHELYAGTRYLDMGYEALFFYRLVEDRGCYEKAAALLGGQEAARFITPNAEKGGRAPDLLVFDTKTGACRFVECKGKTEPFTRRQVDRFKAIEAYLNTREALPKPLSDPRHPDLFPALPPGQWIHVARLVPQ